jgi:hypothetical protein
MPSRLSLGTSHDSLRRCPGDARFRRRASARALWARALHLRELRRWAPYCGSVLTEEQPVRARQPRPPRPQGAILAGQAGPAPGPEPLATALPEASRWGRAGP